MKARDIIPGWPRGRSTSRPLQYNRRIAAFFVTETFFINEAPYFDHGRAALKWAEEAEERQAERAEERRKTEMMKGWYAIDRVLLRFEFTPDSYLQRHMRKQLRKQWNRPAPNLPRVEMCM